MNQTFFSQLVFIIIEIRDVMSDKGCRVDGSEIIFQKTKSGTVKTRSYYEYNTRYAF